MSDRLLTAEEVAYEMGCSVSFVYKQRARGVWPASVKISGGESEKGWRWTAKDLEMIKAKCVLTGGASPLIPLGEGESRRAEGRYRPKRQEKYGPLKLVS